MKKNSESLFPPLGTGFGLKPFYFSKFTEEKPKCVEWVEIVSDGLTPMKSGVPADQFRRAVEKLRQNYELVFHGVSMSLGSADGVSMSYLKQLKKTVSEFQPAWVSDHLCWSGVDGHHLHDLLPLPYTEEVVRHVADQILRTQDFLNRRILIENVSSYMETTHSEMNEYEFLCAVAERADCGILLDVNNIFVSSKNHGLDPHKYIAAVPVKRVGQIHLAGHTDLGTHLVDTHDAPVRPEVWELYRMAVRKFGNVSAMIERDGNFPKWSEMEAELLKIKEIQKNEQLSTELPTAI